MVDAEQSEPALTEERRRDRLKRYARKAVAVPFAVRTGDLPVRAASALAMVAITALAMWIGGWFWSVFALLIGVVVLTEWTRLVLRMTTALPGRLAGVVLGLVYVGFGAFVLAVLGNGDLASTDGAPAWGVIAIISVVAATDTGAYFAGRAIGGPKIAPSISPSKTWAGLGGGMVAAGVTLGLFGELLTNNFSFPIAAAIGAGAAIIAQAGDFLESGMKRRAGVKDSGNLIPGHGGFFDRVDGLLAVAWVTGVIILAALVQSTDL